VATTALRTTALHDAHQALGAKMVEFGGYEMPLHYPSGTVAEHLACRRDAVVFDVSHLGTVRVTGPAALATLQAALCNDLTKVRPGRAQYSQALNDDGGVLDDVIVWWVDETRFDVMPMVAGTGYTGEDGVEIAVENDDAEAVLEAVLGTGVSPAGLGARDTLRLEAALPLHGHELSASITPLEAGLSWVVGWNKAAFRGKAALEVQRAAGPVRTLRGVVAATRQPPREGSAVHVDGHVVGTVTSGNFSPVLEHGIGLCLVASDGAPAPGDAVELEVRGRTLAATCARLPFVGKRG